MGTVLGPLLISYGALEKDINAPQASVSSVSEGRYISGVVKIK